MPAHINAATPTLTMPASLSSMFTRTRTFLARKQEYPCGEFQASPASFAPVPQDRASWQVSKRLMPTQIQALATFRDQVGGEHKAFSFYDPNETNPPFAANPTGSTGRYTARLASGWSELNGLYRGTVTLTIVEVF